MFSSSKVRSPGTLRGRIQLAVTLAGAMAVIAFAIFTILHSRQAMAADAPATMPSTAPSAMTAEQLGQELSATSQALSQVMPSPTDLLDPKLRESNAPKIIPLLRKLDAGFVQLANLNPEMKSQVDGQRVSLLAMLAVLGDEQTNADLKKAATGSGNEAINAKSALMAADWWRAAKDPAVQGKIVESVKALAAANPLSDSLAMTAMMMSEMGSSSRDLSNALRKIIMNDLKGPMAQAIAPDLAAVEKMRAMEGKPLTIAGPQLDGKPFTTADWKGKVILVDFWATWCVPCVQALPHVAKAYADFHSKGLEVVGVSNDYKASELTDFLALHKEVAWPQLFDAAAAAKPDLNPITVSFGINSIPVMFLIDKKGICRSVEAHEDFEEQIPKLLAE